MDKLEKIKNKRKKKKLKRDWKMAGLALVVLALFVFNYFFDISLRHNAMIAGIALGNAELSAEDEQAAMTFLKFRQIKKTAIPFGIPEVYGKELDVSFDDVQESMNKMRGMGPTYGTEGEKLTLTGDELKRFVDIGQKTACEYCCGVRILVNDDGSAACGCAHSIVMRGLAAYLIQNHSNDMTDDEILETINKWKQTFFPKQTLAAIFDELKQDGDTDIDTMLKEFPDFLPQMVGGC